MKVQLLLLAKLLDREGDDDERTPEQDEEALLQLLTSLHDTLGKDVFQAALTRLQWSKTPSKPGFPKAISLKKIAPVPPNQVDAFTAQYIDNSKLRHDSSQAVARIGRDPQQLRDLQFARWQWACDHVGTYVNMLRVSGFSDGAIATMWNHGKPLCFTSATGSVYQSFLTSLTELTPKLEEETQWMNVGFVFTGSSVVGFSQNPLKGKELEPSKITSTEKSDVDICIRGRGVTESFSTDDASIQRFNTTCSRITSGIRFGVEDLDAVSMALADWYVEWSAKLPGGLQITFSEDTLELPPWETRIPLLVANAGETPGEPKSTTPTNGNTTTTLDPVEESNDNDEDGGYVSDGDDSGSEVTINV